ncbi:NAD(P)H-flavin reductase [Marinomonas posidonica]|uniref:NAD(P)H-flavin reductase n=1 Tax=Marinomonas posidonica TaxID=936476 RepID=UPI0037366F6C
MNEVTAKVKAVELVNKDVYQVTLEMDSFSFISGQYVMIQLPTGEQVPYSIGSAPGELPLLTLYILVSDPDSLAHKVVEHLRQSSEVSLKAPGGDCHLESEALSLNSEHILLIAGGTGFAQVKSLFSDLVARRFQGKISFYWGVRTPQDTFAEAWLESAKQHDNVSVSLVVNDGSDEWNGRTGWLYEAILADHPDLSDSAAFISGSVGMVYGTLDQLEAKGLKENNCFSDVFAYAPRPEKPQL